MTSAEFLTAIEGNVDDWYAGRISHEEFHSRQVTIWDEIRAADKTAQVRASLREKLPTVRS